MNLSMNTFANRYMNRNANIAMNEIVNVTTMNMTMNMTRKYIHADITNMHMNTNLFKKMNMYFDMKISELYSKVRMISNEQKKRIVLFKSVKDKPTLITSTSTVP
uniref:Uncharacterized protein n=1 Tax=Glossina austeni TaxID=7395 RepID=A0A1A9VQC2_GLOAU